MARQRLDVNQAAEVLGVSTDAVRKRARRGSLDSEKGEDGRMYIWLDGGAPSGSTPTQAHLDSLQEQIDFLRRELERKDAILLSMTEAMKALNPPAHEEPPESPESTGEDPGSTSPPQEQEQSTSRPWWRRWFG